MKSSNVIYRFVELNKNDDVKKYFNKNDMLITSKSAA